MTDTPRDPQGESPPFGRVLLSELTPGEVVIVPMTPGERGRPREAIVLLDLLGKPRAYINRCKHVPIPLDGGSRKFFDFDNAALICGTHGARYRLDNGYCEAGPCRGDSLDALDLRIEGGIIELRERANHS